MSRWRRKQRNETDGEGTGDVAAAAQFADVKIVKRQPAGVLAELSEAFGDDDTTPTAKPVSDPGSSGERRSAGTTIAIGGDDLPDAVYLDEDVDASAPVFIDDDGTGDAMAAKDAAASGIEPRLRQRRIGVRRAEGRRRLRLMAITAGIAMVVIAVLAVLGSSLFAIDRVDVAGLQRADAEAVQAIVDDLTGRPVLLADTDAAERRLEAIPYVQSARVRTEFPSSATIELRERTPVATTEGADGRFRILDAEGRVVDVIDGQPVAFVLLTGPTTLDLDAGQFAGIGYSAATSMVTKLTPEIRTRLLSIAVSPDGSDMRFVLSNDPGPDVEVRLGAALTDNDQIERLVRLQLVLDDIIKPDTTVIDVSTVESTER